MVSFSEKIVSFARDAMFPEIEALERQSHTAIINMTKVPPSMNSTIIASLNKAMQMLQQQKGTNTDVGDEGLTAILTPKQTNIFAESMVEELYSSMVSVVEKLSVFLMPISSQNTLLHCAGDNKRNFFGGFRRKRLMHTGITEMAIPKNCNRKVSCALATKQI